MARDPQYNDRRLVARRKLLTLGKEVVRLTSAEDTALECRTSLHNPTTFNGMRVNRLWAYLTRAKAEKRRLKGVLGSELARTWMPPTAMLICASRSSPRRWR